ncbi:MAG: hypothetical protein U0V75_01420 [Ferruginibacter sp.]
MPKSISVQSGYILKAEAVPAGKLPLKFNINTDGKLEMDCKVIFPKTLGGVKINDNVKPDDPNQWEYGEIEVLLGEMINSSTNPEIFFTGIEGDLRLNITVQISAKKVWQMGADSKVWQMG